VHSRQLTDTKLKQILNESQDPLSMKEPLLLECLPESLLDSAVLFSSEQHTNTHYACTPLGEPKLCVRGERVYFYNKQNIKMASEHCSRSFSCKIKDQQAGIRVGRE
jgi:hypothetical protein